MLIQAVCPGPEAAQLGAFYPRGEPWRVCRPSPPRVLSWPHADSLSRPWPHSCCSVSPKPQHTLVGRMSRLALDFHQASVSEISGEARQCWRAWGGRRPVTARWHSQGLSVTMRDQPAALLRSELTAPF